MRHEPSAFRGQLIYRFLLAAGVAASACGGRVTVEGGAGGASAGHSPSTQGPAPWTTQCFAWDEQATCPIPPDANMYIPSFTGCGYVVGPISSPVAQCCYEVQSFDSCSISSGPPYLAQDGARAAGVSDVEQGWAAAGALADVSRLDDEARAILAAAWRRDGLYEHASVASFGRFALELLAVGAPPELVAAAHQAALDEVRHARACLALAADYDGQPVGPGAFPFDGAVPVSHDLADVAARAALEGCVGETVAAVIAAEQLAQAKDPAVREALAMIACDEANHAELAWRTVAWAMTRGGEAVRRAVENAFTAALLAPAQTFDAHPEPNPALARHGRLDAGTLARVRRQALDEIIAPCAARLLATGRAAAA
jgi:hypothetical protein